MPDNTQKNADKGTNKLDLNEIDSMLDQIAGGTKSSPKKKKRPKRRRVSSTRKSSPPVVAKPSSEYQEVTDDSSSADDSEAIQDGDTEVTAIPQAMETADTGVEAHEEGGESAEETMPDLPQEGAVSDTADGLSPDEIEPTVVDEIKSFESEEAPTPEETRETETEEEAQLVEESQPESVAVSSDLEEPTLDESQAAQGASIKEENTPSSESPDTSSDNEAMMDTASAVDDTGDAVSMDVSEIDTENMVEVEQIEAEEIIEAEDLVEFEEVIDTRADASDLLSYNPATQVDVESSQTISDSDMSSVADALEGAFKAVRIDSPSKDDGTVEHSSIEFDESMIVSSHDLEPVQEEDAGEPTIDDAVEEIDDTIQEIEEFDDTIQEIEEFDDTIEEIDDAMLEVVNDEASSESLSDGSPLENAEVAGELESQEGFAAQPASSDMLRAADENVVQPDANQVPTVEPASMDAYGNTRPTMPTDPIYAGTGGQNPVDPIYGGASSSSKGYNPTDPIYGAPSPSPSSVPPTSSTSSVPPGSSSSTPSSIPTVTPQPAQNYSPTDPIYNAPDQGQSISSAPPKSPFDPIYGDPQPSTQPAPAPNPMSGDSSQSASAASDQNQGAFAGEQPAEPLKSPMAPIYDMSPSPASPVPQQPTDPIYPGSSPSPSQIPPAAASAPLTNEPISAASAPDIAESDAAFLEPEPATSVSVEYGAESMQEEVTTPESAYASRRRDNAGVGQESMGDSPVLTMKEEELMGILGEPTPHEMAPQIGPPSGMLAEDELDALLSELEEESVAKKIEEAEEIEEIDDIDMIEVDD